MSRGTLVMLDNQDSFTYNLVDELAQLGYALEVYRNTVSLQVIEQRLAELKAQGQVALILSPGPGHPNQAGVLMELIASAVGRYPILGICLGFQALIEHFGGTVGRCFETVHGKSALIETQEHAIFKALSSPLSVARYHSLQALTVPPAVNIVAQVNNIPMAFVHEHKPVVGFQFHPESIMTIHGSALLKNTIEYLLQEKAHA
ncbi:aminodeoxychorismate/anthranilate synthase component II [Aliidiomarina celeris]|uniref:aminodeoxychorismate/anthranilate synthase component II n=1 Tax=Aliidiomarina celeris TaxID=2249428 RepID=UPI000DEABD12|nr:aminodeoxychorismate/anthranilate synthase component II [Aliidiomarina celeris]